MMRAALIWGAVLVATIAPIIIAAQSPLLAWRDGVYIIAGFGGILALSLTVFQPLLAQGRLPGITSRPGRRFHRAVGAVLVLAVLVHVVGLWITSPPDVIDALLFVSPTPFAVWGVAAMWAAFAAALLAVLRRRLRMSPLLWRRTHAVLVSTLVTGSVVHAVLIEGAMGTFSKIMLCLFALIVLGWALRDMRIGPVRR